MNEDPMTERNARLAKILQRFDMGAAELMADPVAIRRRIDEDLIAEHGQEWFDANKRYLDDEWKFACELLGLI